MAIGQLLGLVKIHRSKLSSLLWLKQKSNGKELLFTCTIWPLAIDDSKITQYLKKIQNQWNGIVFVDAQSRINVDKEKDIPSSSTSATNTNLIVVFN